MAKHSLADFAAANRRRYPCITCALPPALLKQVNEGLKNKISRELIVEWLRDEGVDPQKIPAPSSLGKHWVNHARDASRGS